MNHPLEPHRHQLSDDSATPAEAELLALEPLPAPAPSGANVIDPRGNPLRHVKAQVQVCVGEAVVSVGDLLSAKQGHVIALDRKIDEVVDVLIEGQVVARGQLVAVDDVFGVRITELPLPLTP